MNRDVLQKIIRIIKLLRTHDNNQEAEKFEMVSALEAELAKFEHNHFSDAMSVLADVNADLIKEAALAQSEQEPDVTGNTGQEPVAWVSLIQEAQAIVEGKYLFKRFIDGTPLSNDIAVWMTEFALKYTAPTKPEQELDYPPECTTPEMKVAYCAGWWKALEVQRNKQQALDKKADNARELGLDYEPDVTLTDEGDIPDHGFDRTASHMAGEYVDTAGTEHQFKYVAYGLRADENGKLSIGELPMREWVGLTQDEIDDICQRNTREFTEQAKLIETKLREKNESA